MSSSRLLAYVVWALVLNLPYALCHPSGPLVDQPLLRSLSVNLVLFILPGLPFTALRARRIGWHTSDLLRTIVISSFCFLAILVTLQLFDAVGNGALLWNGSWLIANVGLIANLRIGGTEPWQQPIERRVFLGSVALFAIAYGALFLGASRIVPVLGDQDDEIQGTAYGLIMRLEPSLATGRGTDYVFAHPPLVHAYAAGSLLHYGLLPDLAFFDSQSANPPSLQESSAHYFQNPHLLETRGANIFFSALTVVLMGYLGMLFSSQAAIGVLVALAYLSTPEIFVRSSYGGYFALSAFALVQLLLAVEVHLSNPGPLSRRFCYAAGAFAALTNHKLILLPAAIVVWGFLRSRRTPLLEALKQAILQPAPVGFLFGSAAFWLWGAMISPRDFWMDHVRHHLIDRVLNHNARGMDLSRYPDLGELWGELWQHTGYLLLPLGAIALIVLCFARSHGDTGEPATRGWKGMPGLWLVWSIGLAIAFSIVDWRQTKHLAPLCIPLFLGLGAVSNKQKVAGIVGLLLLAMFLWNLTVLSAMNADFQVLIKKPEW